MKTQEGSMVRKDSDVLNRLVYNPGPENNGIMYGFVLCFLETKQVKAHLRQKLVASNLTEFRISTILSAQIVSQEIEKHKTVYNIALRFIKHERV